MATQIPPQADGVVDVGLAAVTHTYGSVKALQDVTLDLEPGTTVLLGRNGAGKSTLCRMLTGIERPDDGKLVRNGRELTRAEDWRAHHADTGWLPQHLAAPLSMRVEHYLRYASWLKRVTPTDVEMRVNESLRRTDLADQRARRLGQLSGGMLRRAGIAQAVVHEPRLLVLDEPTVGLDPEQRARFHDIVRTLAADRIVFISTHLLEDVEAFPGRVVVLNNGTVCYDATTEELADRGRRVRREGADASRSEQGAGSGYDGSPHLDLRAGFLDVLAASDRRLNATHPRQEGDRPGEDSSRTFGQPDA